MPAANDANAVTSVDNVRRSLVLLGALLYPLSDERAALEAGDAAGYVDAIAARMRGICGQSAAILENALKALAEPTETKKAKKSRRRRPEAQTPGGLPDGVRADVEAIFAEYELPDVPRRLAEGHPPGAGADAGLSELVPLAARLAATSVRLASLAADRIDPASQPAGDVASGADGSRAEVVANGTGRTARRIAVVIDDWDMLAGSPEAIIGCPPPPGSAAPDASGDGRRSLGVAAALGGAGASSAGRSTMRRGRTQPVWSAGGAVQRD